MKNFRPSITIDEESQKLFIELLSKYSDYDNLPEDAKSVISENSYKSLVSNLISNKEIKPRFSKLYVLVDYINDFVTGSLGSESALLIENSVKDQLVSMINDKDTAVIVLIDSHYNDKSYLQSREGRHLPTLHANTSEGRKIYGSVGEVLEKYYDSYNEGYISNSDDGIWFIEKTTFGVTDMTRDIDREVSESVDKILDLCEDEDIESASNYMERDVVDKMYLWNHLYETSVNLSNIEFIPEEITIAGVATNICVLSNAIILQNEFPQAEIYVDSSTVASYNNVLHEYALEIMKGIGINVKD